MGYRSIVISSSAKLSVKNNSLVIDGETCAKIPLEDIRSVIIENRASTVTAYALTALSDAGVCVYFCDDKHLPCAFIQPFCRHTRQKKRIVSQFSQTKPNLKRLWQSIVVAKIKNQAKCLELCGVDSEYYQRLYDLSYTVQSGDIKNVEGQAAALYFKYLFGSDFSRGSDSGVNAFLNYGYAVLRGFIARTLADYGFEPCIGIHHHSDLNNFNLADDVIEPFRPLVDLFVFQNLYGNSFSSQYKKELCNILNYEVIADNKHHCVAYAIELLVQSLERCFDADDCKKLILPSVEKLKRHQYE